MVSSATAIIIPNATAMEDGQRALACCLKVRQKFRMPDRNYHSLPVPFATRKFSVPC